MMRYLTGCLNLSHYDCLIRYHKFVKLGFHTSSLTDYSHDSYLNDDLTRVLLQHLL